MKRLSVLLHDCNDGAFVSVNDTTSGDNCNVINLMVINVLYIYLTANFINESDILTCD